MNKVGSFEIKLNADTISIGNLSFAPAEADRLQNIVGFAGGMSKLKTLPARIGEYPFDVKFFEDGSLSVERAGTNQSVKMEFGEIDDFLKAINIAIGSSKDERILRPQPRRTGQIGRGFPDVFEGKS